MIASTFKNMYFDKYPGWETNPATVWACTDDTFSVVNECLDPYELITDFVRHGISGKSVLALSGWGAPLNDDGELDAEKPSVHPDRIRIVLFLHMDNLAIDVTMNFQDGRIEHTEGMPGSGALAEAIALAIEETKKEMAGK